MEAILASSMKTEIEMTLWEVEALGEGKGHHATVPDALPRWEYDLLPTKPVETKGTARPPSNSLCAPCRVLPRNAPA